MKIYCFVFMLLPLFCFGENDSIALLVNSKITVDSDNPVHSIMLYVEKEGDNILYDHAFGRYAKSGKEVLKDSPFKIASSTKTFVATIILQLAEEGKLDLDHNALSYLKNNPSINYENFHRFKGKNYARQITIKQLLSHRTGLADIFADKEQEFFQLVLDNPQKRYTPKLIVDLYFQLKLNESPHFKPGKGWHYSDMNYVLLGFIIENIEKKPLHESIRKRILDPLKMKDTYFEYYEKTIMESNRVNQFVGTINFTDFNTSFDWAGGGLVSTNQNLAIFIKALFTGKLINAESLKNMIDVKFTRPGENRYGLGVYETEFNGDIFFGHYGFYGTYIGYCPNKKIILSYCINQANPDFWVHEVIDNILRYLE